MAGCFHIMCAFLDHRYLADMGVSMPKRLSSAAKAASVKLIISITRRCGRLTVKEASKILGLHRSTTEKYFREAEETGEVVRHGRCGLFRDLRATIDFDLQRFSYSPKPQVIALPPLAQSEVYRRVITVTGAMR
jgi:hypothetical protein